MVLHIVAAGAALTMLAAPAWADCAEDAEALEAQVVAAETGAATEASEGMPATEHQTEVLSDEAGAATGDSDSVAESDMPATEHQEEVLSGEEAPMETGAGVGDVEAASPHQRQAVRALDEETKAQASALLDEARSMAQAGDEAGCEAKLSDVRQLVGAQGAQ